MRRGPRRPWTIVQYRSEVERFAAWTVANDLRIEDVTRLDVEAYVAHMRTTRGLGGRSVAARLTAIRGLYDWALTSDTAPLRSDAVWLYSAVG